MAAAGYIAPIGTMYNIGPMPGETPLAMIPGGIISSAPSIIGTNNKTFAGSGNVVNATPSSPGSFTIRNGQQGSTGNAIGALSTDDIAGHIINQLASFALSNSQPGVNVIGGGGNFLGGSRSPTPAGIVGSGAKFYG